MPDTSFTQFTLGKYRVIDLLGKGGFGTVYRALDTTLDREVALKLLHPQLVADPDFVKRFRNEAKSIAALRHPNVVGVYELGEEGGRVFIAMEYMPGGTLKDRLEQRGRLSFDETLAIMQQVCAGLEAAHDKGLIHRDIKPGNILFDANGNAVVGDFGLARAMQLSGLSSQSSSAGGVGTPFYKAPELWRGKPPVSPATDVYALACVVYEMLTGRVLFSGDMPDEVITKHLVDGPEFGNDWPPSDAPSGLVEVIKRALSRDPSERYADAQAFDDAIVTTKTSVEREAAELARQAQEAEIKKEQERVEQLEREAAELARQKQETATEAERLKKVAAEKERRDAEAASIAAQIRRDAEEQKKRQAAELSRQKQEAATEAERSKQEAAEKKRREADAVAIAAQIQRGAEEKMKGEAEERTRRDATEQTQREADERIRRKAEQAHQSALKEDDSTSQTETPSVDLPQNTNFLSPRKLGLMTAARIFLLFLVIFLGATRRGAQPTAMSALSIGSTKISDKDGMTLVYVPAGNFLMGATDSDTQADADQKPQHTVYLDAFWIDQTDVTNGMYAKCVQAGNCQVPANKSSATYSSYYGNSQFDNFPVTNVAWTDATAYCHWVGGDLPTEAQWEKAARGTDGRLYPWGNDTPNSSLLNFNLNVGDITKVGKYASGASPYGVLDMAGNVWQWVRDWYDGHYYASSPSRNPTGPATGQYHVLRGGSWNFVEALVRVSYRGLPDPVNWFYGVGFRCVR